MDSTRTLTSTGTTDTGTAGTVTSVDTGTAGTMGTTGTPATILTKGGGGRKKKLRVAGYARVSTDLVEQEGSIELQIRTLHDQIKANPEYELAGIFADDGLTGTQADKRPQLMELIKACEGGKVDRIITKSLSRFARNTLDTLTNLRKFKELGVTIFFQKENIDTAAAYSDMLLTIMAAFSQEESRSISENVKWGIRKRYEQGIARWSRLYGYGKDGETEYVIIPEEAAVVKRIFNEAEMNKGTKEIAKKLNEDKIPTKDGAKKGWSASVVASLLHNERYKGCILLQKSYTEDHLTHHVVKNDFKEVPAYSIENHHEGIVDAEQFDRVQKILAMKKRAKGETVQYPFGDMVRCPYCGGAMRQEYLRFGSEGGKAWVCKKDGRPEFIMRSVIIEEGVKQAYKDLVVEGESAEAEKARAWKAENPSYETVDYFWIGRLISHITFGKHEGFIKPEIPRSQYRGVERTGDDFTMTVHWKWGQESTIDSGIERLKDVPGVIAEIYR